MHYLPRQLTKVNKFCFFFYIVNLFYIFWLGTKREADLDDISPTKLKALKAARNGTNGGGVVDDESSNHKNGDEHLPDDEDEDDDVCLRKKF